MHGCGGLLYTVFAMLVRIAIEPNESRQLFVTGNVRVVCDSDCRH